MSNIISKSLLIVFSSCLPALLLAATHYKEPQRAEVTAVDTKKRIIILSDELYYMNSRIKVNDVGNNFPGIKDLKPRMAVKFRTIKSKKTNRVEVREIWILPI